jgi:transposase
MSYRIAGIDVHKKMLAVVVADVEVQGEYQFERIRYGSNPEQLRLLAAWLMEHEVEEVVMESTAQYWQPVWGALERYWKPSCQKREGAGPMSGTLHLAQARSNRGRKGRKKDFPDAERLVKRLVADELILSFVPDAEQRLWRTVTRRKYQLRRNKVRLQNQLEAILEEAHIKLSRRSPMEEPIRPPWPLWPIRSCVPQRHSYATRWAHARSSNPTTADCSRCFWRSCN